MVKYNIGDRIVDNYLGSGEVLKIYSEFVLLVLFDKTPEYQYNLSTNPCLCFTSDIIKEIK